MPSNPISSCPRAEWILYVLLTVIYKQVDFDSSRMMLPDTLADISLFISQIVYVHKRFQGAWDDRMSCLVAGINLFIGHIPDIFAPSNMENSLGSA